MRKLVRISVRSDNITLDRKAIGNPVISQDLNKIIEKYAALSVQPYLHSLNYAYFYFYEDTEEYNQFRTDAEKLNMVMGEQCKYILSDDELDKVDFFQIELEQVIKSGFFSLLRGNKYEGGCDWCKGGMVLKGKCRVPVRGIDKYDIFPLEPEIIVTKTLKTLFESEEITGIEFDSVVDSRNGKDVDNLFRLKIWNQLPEMHKDTLKVIGTCSVCNKVYTNLQGNIIFSIADLDGALDFNVTLEHFFRENDLCKTGELNYEWPYIVVSKKVKRLMEQHCRGKNFYFIPVITL